MTYPDKRPSITKIADTLPYRTVKESEALIRLLKREIVELALDDARYTISTPARTPDVDIVISTVDTLVQTKASRGKMKELPKVVSTRKVTLHWKTTKVDLATRWEIFELEMYDVMVSAYENVREHLQWYRTNLARDAELVLQKVMAPPKPPPPPVTVSVSYGTQAELGDLGSSIVAGNNVPSSLAYLGTEGNMLTTAISASGSGISSDFKERIERFMTTVTNELERMNRQWAELSPEMFRKKPSTDAKPAPPEASA